MTTRRGTNRIPTVTSERRRQLPPPSPLPQLQEEAGYLKRYLRRLRDWLAGPWLPPRPAPAIEGSPVTPLALSITDDDDLTQSDGHAVHPLSQALDRRAGARSVFASLALVEHILLRRGPDDVAGLSPWILSQALKQLESLADIRQQRDLVGLYLHLRQSARTATTHGSATLPAHTTDRVTTFLARWELRLQLVATHRAAEVRALAERLNPASAAFDRQLVPLAEDDLDAFRLRVMEEAARVPGSRFALAGAELNHEAIAAAERWLDQTVGHRGLQAEAVAVVLVRCSRADHSTRPDHVAPPTRAAMVFQLRPGSDSSHAT